MNTRYIKNLSTLLTEEQQNNLLTKHIGVIGCGGNGSYIIEFLARLGVKKISMWDGDVFEKSNLNRQIYCNENTLGMNKAEIAVIRAEEINPTITYHPYTHYFADKLTDLNKIEQCDLLFLCADVNHNWNKQRIMLRMALSQKIPMIDCPVVLNGAKAMFFNQDNISVYDRYSASQNQWIHNLKEISQPAYLCSLAASLGINMMIKYFNGTLTKYIDEWYA